MTTPLKNTTGVVIGAKTGATRREAPRNPAETSLGNISEVVEMSAWFEQHTAMVHQFLHRAMSVVANTPANRKTKLVRMLGVAHGELIQHTRKIAGSAVPTVLSRDSKYSIPYERLAEARAMVQALTFELAEAKSEIARLQAARGYTDA